MSHFLYTHPPSLLANISDFCLIYMASILEQEPVLFICMPSSFHTTQCSSPQCGSISKGNTFLVCFLKQATPQAPPRLQVTFCHLKKNFFLIYSCDIATFLCILNTKYLRNTLNTKNLIFALLHSHYSSQPLPTPSTKTNKPSNCRDKSIGSYSM